MRVKAHVLHRSLIRIIAAFVIALTTASTLATGQAIATTAATPQCTQAVVVPKNIDPDGAYVPAASNGSRTCFMARGDVSEGVLALQMALRSCYGKAIAADEQFGPKTETALREVQSKLHISHDGMYGPQTHGAILFDSVFDQACLRD